MGDVASVLVSLPNNRNDTIAPGNFVIREPLIKRFRDSRAKFLDILNAVHILGDRVFDVDYQDFPVGFAAVVGCYGSQDFRLPDLAKVPRVLPDVEEVDRVVVAGFVGEGVADVGVLPGLGDLFRWVLIVAFCYQE